MDPRWQDSLPEILRDAPYIGKAESAEDAVSKLAHAAKLVGTSIRIPEADAKPEEMAAFFAKVSAIDGVAQLPTSEDKDGLNALMTKLGKPEDVSGYKLPELDGFAWNEATADNLRRYALDAGMTANQFTAFANNVAKQEQETGISAQTASEDARKALRMEWGETLEDREALIRGYLEHSQAPESVKQGLNDKKLPLETMNWLHEIAKQFKGDVKPISNDGPSPTPDISPQEALEAIPRLIGDLMGMKETDPRYAGIQQKLVSMHRLAKPEQAA